MIKKTMTRYLRVYRNALDLDPQNAKIHCNLGFLYWEKVIQTKLLENMNTQLNMIKVTQ